MRNLQEALVEIIHESNRPQARGHHEALKTIGDFLGSLREFLEFDCIPVTTGMKYKQDQFTGRDPQTTSSDPGLDGVARPGGMDEFPFVDPLASKGTIEIIG